MERNLILGRTVENKHLKLFLKVIGGLRRGSGVGGIEDFTVKRKDKKFLIN